MGSALLPTCLFVHILDVLFEYLRVSFSSAAVHSGMCGAMGVCKYHYAAS